MFLRGEVISLRIVSGFRGLLFEVEYQAGVGRLECVLLERRELRESKRACLLFGDYGRNEAVGELWLRLRACGLTLSFAHRSANEA
jgi:hypothetical protein